jgi:uncharacterized membrane protein
MKVNPHRSSLGMDANVMALICYIAAFVLSWIPIVKWVAWAAPLVIFFIEKESPFVKFHAMQAFLLEVVAWIIQLIFSIIIGIAVASVAYNPYNWGSWRATAGVAGVFSVLSVIISILLTIVAVIALIKAYGYFEFKIPVVGNMAMKFSRKNNMPMQ